MALLLVLMWLVLPNRALLSGLDHCGVHDGSSSNNMSPWLQSLQCHNDYKTHVDCKWKAPTNTTLQVWLRGNDGSSELCVPFKDEKTTEDGVVQCRYKTLVLGVGISHTVFFTNNQTTSFCSSSKHTSLDLVQRLRAHPPGGLTASEESDGSYWLKWSSPYPPSSSLNQNLSYQLSFRTQDEDGWTTEAVADTSVRLERQKLLPGRRYEARVRARAGVGRWSEWSPVASWKTGDDLGQVPSLDCVLDGEKEVTCSWEVSRELAYLVTYQLTCRHDLTARFEGCCVNPAVSSDPGGTEVRYSCPLTDVDPERLQLKLQPAHNAKTFQAYKHIRTNSPVQVKVRENNGDWVVEWSPPAEAATELLYQVWYYRTTDQGSTELLNISEGSTRVSILGTSLVPLQDYKVKVRSLVAPGAGSTYEGIPSEWSEPANWTSNKATWSVSTLIYFFCGVIAAALFLTLYHTIPVCRKEVVMWVDSVPSPGKSKSLSEIKSSSSPTLVQSEKTSICSVQHLDRVSTCRCLHSAAVAIEKKEGADEIMHLSPPCSSSEALLWPTKSTETTGSDQSRSCWNCDNLPSPNAHDLDTSSMSFSGPYIFCQGSGQMSMEVQQEEVRETKSDEAVPLFPAPCPLRDGDYVCLPNRTLSRSTEDLTSHSSSGPKWYDSPEQGQQHLNATLRPVQSGSRSGFGEPAVRSQPPDYTAGPLPSWPQGGANSGYCQLPAAFTVPPK
ncbi:cytokine receptor common subunit beta isoform X1 [Xiphophorus hellerii]|uniref:cytokine receptor common subunit beta isoform X1 n=1 Tax=Xiphophorus hellerii TaxID=8084 RepID=UPI0013B41210|nr:cytokine receptor common subunit beta-like isoform X1 [Xiphophorus hellerii]